MTTDQASDCPDRYCGKCDMSGHQKIDCPGPVERTQHSATRVESDFVHDDFISSDADAVALTSIEKTKDEDITGERAIMIHIGGVEQSDVVEP